jgi:hypothetical protein
VKELTASLRDLVDAGVHGLAASLRTLLDAGVCGPTLSLGETPSKSSDCCERGVVVVVVVVSFLPPFWRFLAMLLICYGSDRWQVHT